MSAFPTAIAIFVALSAREVSGWVRIQSVENTGKYLEVQSNCNGLEFDGYRSNEKQKWVLGQQGSTDYYTIKTKEDDCLKCVCCDGVLFGNCAWPKCWCNSNKAKYVSGHDSSLNLYKQTGDNEEEWGFVLVSGQSYYQIKNRGNNKCMYRDGGDAKRRTCADTTDEYFYVLDDDDNVTTLRSTPLVDYPLGVKEPGDYVYEPYPWAQWLGGLFVFVFVICCSVASTICVIKHFAINLQANTVTVKQYKRVSVDGTSDEE